MLTLSLETGDLKSQTIINFKISSNGIINLALENSIVEIQKSNWKELFKQVSKRELTYWREYSSPLPIGSQEMKVLLNKINSTESYQLFLAGFDIANEIDLSNILPDKLYENNTSYDSEISIEIPEEVKLYSYLYKKLSGKSISIDNSLNIFPENYYALIPREFKREIMLQNKIGTIKFIYGDKNIIDFIYKPYLTPIAPRTTLSLEAKEYLKKIYFYLKK